MASQEKYNQLILESLRRGALLSKDIKERLQKAFDVSSQNARKIIERAVESGVVRSSSPVSFGKGQYAYYLSLKLEIKDVIRISKTTRPPIHRLLSVMEMGSGVISYYEALKITAAPLGKGSTKVDSLPKIVNDLEQLGLIAEVETEGVKFLVHKPLQELDNLDKLLRIHRAKMVVDCAILPDIIGWLKSHNLIDNDQVIYRKKSLPSLGAKHNNFIWDAFAYTKVVGIGQIKGKNAPVENKKTLVVLDVVLSRDYTEHDLKGFLSRTQIVANSTRTGLRKILPIVFFRSTSPTIKSSLRGLNILNFEASTIYGEKIFQILEGLLQIKTEELFNESSLHRVEETIKLIQEAGQESNLSNLKGDLFESLLFRVIKSAYPDALISWKKLVKLPGSKEYELDYVVRTERELIIVELKGFRHNAHIELGDRNPTEKDKNTVRWFFCKVFPAAKEFFKFEPGSLPIKACYITSARFTNEAMDFLTKLNQGKLKPKKLELFYDGDRLLNLIKEHELLEVGQVIEKYFMKDAKA